MKYVKSILISQPESSINQNVAIHLIHQQNSNSSHRPKHERLPEEVADKVNSDFQGLHPAHLLPAPRGSKSGFMKKDYNCVPLTNGPKQLQETKMSRYSIGVHE